MVCGKYFAKMEKALTFVIGMFILGKHSVIELGTVCGFEHPLGVLEHTPVDNGDHRISVKKQCFLNTNLVYLLLFKNFP